MVIYPNHPSSYSLLVWLKNIVDHLGHLLETQLLAQMRESVQQCGRPWVLSCQTSAEEILQDCHNRHSESSPQLRNSADKPLLLVPELSVGKEGRQQLRCLGDCGGICQRLGQEASWSAGEVTVKKQVGEAWRSK